MAIRTDLALELARPFGRDLPPGVQVAEQRAGALNLTTVTVQDEAGARAIGKPMGRYITVETQPFASANPHSHAEIEAVADQLAALLPAEGPVLVVGLGNEHITPDALGPRSVDLILATRHISGDPAEGGFAGFRPVAALAPGVLGQTGIESSAIVAAVVQEVSPAAVIVIDALAARSTDRLGTTLQMADSGIHPGAGVGNNRRELSARTLGVPVVSMGIPTVVDAATLAEDLTGSPVPEGAAGMVVTPRDCDLLVERGAKLIALAINRALQRELALEDITYLIS